MDMEPWLLEQRQFAPAPGWQRQPICLDCARRIPQKQWLLTEDGFVCLECAALRAKEANPI